jgi:hypothetical protein
LSVSEAYAWTGLLSDYIVFVDCQRVNIDDLVHAVNPGTIVRCVGNPADAVRVHVSPRDDCLGCVGGMISEL